MKILDLENPDPSYSALIDEVEPGIRSAFQGLMDQLTAGNEGSVDWWVSNLSSRNPFACPFYRVCCHLAVLTQLVRRGESVQVQTSSPALRDVVNQYVHTHGLQRVFVKFTGPRLNWRGRMRNALEAWIAYIFHWNNVYLKRWRKLRSLPRISGQQELSLVSIFLLEERFKENGEYADTYFPGLASHLTSEEMANIHYIFTLYSYSSLDSLVRKVNASQTKFLFKEPYLRLSDLLYAFAFPLRIAKIRFVSAGFMDFDLRAYAYELIQTDRFLSASIEGLLNFRFVKRLAASGARVRILIDWFENQWMNRGLLGGFSRFLPTAKTLGYQGFYFGSTHLNLLPTTSEWNAGVLPTAMAVPGPGFVKERTEFCPGFPVVSGPAFRFGHLFMKRTRFPDPKKPTILAALSQIDSLADEVIAALTAIQEELRSGGYSVHLKPHPVNATTFMAGRRNLPEGFRFVTGDLRECVEVCDVFIGSASGTVLEALAIKTPVVFLPGGHVPSDIPIPMDIPRTVWSICYTSEELLKEILRFTRRDQELEKDLERSSQLILQRYATPVTRATVRALFGYHEDPGKAA